MPGLRIPTEWVNHPVLRILGLAFLGRDLVVTVAAIGAVVIGALGVLSNVAVALGVLALVGVTVSLFRRPSGESSALQREEAFRKSVTPAVEPNALGGLMQEQVRRVPTQGRNLAESVEAGPQSPTPETSEARLRRDLIGLQRKGKQLQASIGSGSILVLGNSTQGAIADWESEVCMRLELAGRGDLADQFAVKQSITPATLATALIPDVGYKRAMEFKLAQLSKIMRSL